MKIPDPIMDPTTSETAASGLMPRMNSEEAPGSDAGGASVGAAMGVLVMGHPERSEGSGSGNVSGMVQEDAPQAELRGLLDQGCQVRRGAAVEGLDLI